MRVCIALIFLFSAGLKVSGQTADFSASEQVCLEEAVFLVDSSENVIQYEWDFCLGGYVTDPVSSDLTLSGVTNAYGFELINDGGVWYGFVLAKSAGNLIRLDYGDSPLNTPVQVNLGNPGGIFTTSQEDLSILQFKGNWYGVVGYGVNGGTIKRINFGSSLTNIPTALDLGNFSTSGRIRNVKLVNDSDSLTLVFADYSGNRVVRVNYGSSFDNTIESGDIYRSSAYTDLSFITGFDIQRVEGDYIVHAVSLLDEDMIRLNFGNSLRNTPVLEATYTLTGITNSYNLSIIREGGRYYGAIGSSSQSLRIYDLGDLSSAPVLQSYSSTLPTSVEVKLFRYGGGNYLRGVNGSVVRRMSFGEDCGASMSYSTEALPAGLSYSTSGEKVIWLEGTGSSGNTAFHLDTVTVGSDQAPDIDFSIDASRCSENTNVFTSENQSRDIASYQWIFGEDTLAASTLPDTVYQFAAGSYTVTLVVESSGGCTNQVSKDITIYPVPPVPAFETSGTLCSGTSLAFDNTTDETGYEGVLSYQWDFDGEWSSGQTDTVYTFESSGTKTIRLIVSLPGCSGATAEEITLNTGPSVDFDWSNNCFGDTIQFENLTSGNGITGYSWDFGDGMGTATAEDTVYKYTATGTYTVSLTVTNTNGCESTLEQTLTVSDDPLVGATYDNAVENEPVQFTGYDLTQDDNAITGWNWYFGGTSTSTDQHPSYAFSDPGTYTVSLEVMTEQGCIGDTTLNVVVSGADYASLSVSLNESACQEEQLSIVNNSVNADSYEWDFCLGGYVSEPISSDLTLSGVTNAYGFELINDGGIWYGFVLAKSAGNLIRLDYGDSPLNTPVQVDLGNPSGVFSTSQEDLSIIKFDGNWYGVVGYGENSGTIKRINFGSSITNTPTATDLGKFGTSGRIRNVKLINDSDSLTLILAEYSGNRLVRVNYGSSFDNTIESGDIYRSSAYTDLSFITGFDLQVVNDEYIVHAISLQSESMIRLNFGSSLRNTPVLEATYTLSGITNNYNLSIIQEGDRYYGAIGSSSQSLRIYDLGDFSSAPVLQSYSSTLPTDVDVKLFRHEGKNYLLGVSGNTLTRLSFGEDCGASVSYSTESTPSGLSYSTSGDKSVWLVGTAGNGNTSDYIATVNILSSEAPDISFSVDEFRCISAINTFTSTNISGDITSYSWDFDGDGLEDSTDPNPTYQYTVAGTYIVHLEVQSDACSNYATDTLTIYPEPPMPSFESPSGQVCPETEMTFTSLVEDSEFNGQLEYHWNITGLGDTTTSGSLTYAFPSGGEKTITLYVSIPGCESEIVSQEFTVESLPQADFQAGAVCAGEVTFFEEQSEGVSFEWNFDDGFVSTEPNPEHLYSTPGTYQVALSILGSNGCANTVTREVVVSGVPEAVFEYDVLCEGESTVRDVSVVTGSDIVLREWYLDQVLVATGVSPSISLKASDENLLQLIVTAANGCSASYSEYLSVLEQPEVQFTADVACLGEVSTLVDTSPDQEEVMSRTWMINGTILSSEESSVSYTFPEAGTYELSLTIDHENLCSAVATQAVEIHTLPVVDFQVSGACENSEVTARDLSQSEADAITSRQWYLDGVKAGNGSETLLPVSVAGNYEVTLEVITDDGCSVSASRVIEIYPQANADFTASNDYGVPPFSLSFINTSSNSTGYEWSLDDALMSTEENTIINFTELGSQSVKLRAISAEGCVDSTSMVILSANPEIDLVVENMQLVRENAEQKVLLNVKNQSNLPVESVIAEITLENEFTLNETISQRINVGEDAVISLHVSLPETTNLAYLCVTLTSVYEVSDENPYDNEQCINVLPVTVFEPVYPNPTRGPAYIRGVLPEEGNVVFTLLNLAGQVVHVWRMSDQPAGLNTFVMDLTEIDAGTYFILIEYAGKTHKMRIIRQ